MGQTCVGTTGEEAGGEGCSGEGGWTAAAGRVAGRHAGRNLARCTLPPHSPAQRTDPWVWGLQGAAPQRSAGCAVQQLLHACGHRGGAGGEPGSRGPPSCRAHPEAGAHHPPAHQALRASHEEEQRQAAAQRAVDHAAGRKVGGGEGHHQACGACVCVCEEG